MCIGSYEYANEADNDDVPKPSNSVSVLPLIAVTDSIILTEYKI